MDVNGRAYTLWVWFVALVNLCVGGHVYFDIGSNIGLVNLGLAVVIVFGEFLSYMKERGHAKDQA